MTVFLASGGKPLPSSPEGVVFFTASHSITQQAIPYLPLDKPRDFGYNYSTFVLSSHPQSESHAGSPGKETLAPFALSTRRLYVQTAPSGPSLSARALKDLGGYRTTEKRVVVSQIFLFNHPRWA